MAIHSDTPAKVDLLNRKPFAEQIGKRIVNGFSNQHECVVMGLNGMWGSGKSTLLSYLKESIRENCGDDIPYLFYDFNPWMFSGQENLQREFLEGLLKILKDHFKKQKALQEWIDKRLEYLKFIKWIPKYGEDAFQIFEKVTKGLDTFGSIKDLKQKVDEILIQENTRLFIFLDDIDRLSPNETTEIFQLIKLNTNFKNSVFIVAYDKQIVESALNHRYGENSGRYLEKIVQVDYKIPEILSEKRQKILLNELDLFLKRESIEYDIQEFEQVWERCGLNKVFRSLRDIYRYLNALHFRLPVIYNEVNITDFFIIELIRIFDNDGYEKLYQEIQLKRTYQLTLIGEISQVSGFSPIVQPMVNYLLPSKNGLPDAKEKAKKRFADYMYSDRYFALQISSFDVSTEEFDIYLKTTDKLSLLKEIASGGRLSDFFLKLSNLKEPSETIEYDYGQIFSSILDLLENNDLQIKYWQVAYNSIDSFIAKSKNKFSLQELYIEHLTQDIIRTSHSRYLFTYFKLEDWSKKGRYNGSPVERSDKGWVQKLQLRQQKFLNDSFLNLMSTHTWKNPPFTAQLYLDVYARDRTKEYIEYTKKLLEDNRCLISLTRQFAMFINDNGRPGRYDYEKYITIFPPPLNAIYIDRLPEVIAILSDGRDKEMLAFMLEVLADKK